MLVYLSKKIPIPNQINLHCISWNHDQGWIACGGENGLLKVLKLETPTDKDAKLKGIAASSNLSMNQSLEGHSGTVRCVTWNPLFRKLTTCDDQGLIIVWALHKGMWYEEMINNRNKSTVTDMKWSPDGRKICIVYEDGAVIVGSVDGNRLWGKEVGFQIKFIEWAPDGNTIAFVSYDTEIWLYDNTGARIRSLSLNDELIGDATIVSLHWYPDETYGKIPTATSASPTAAMNDVITQPYSLAICFHNGMLLLLRHESDSNTMLLKTHLKVTKIQWNYKGDILAVCGALQTNKKNRSQQDEKESDSNTANKKNVNVIQFYDHYGTHIRTLRVPGERVVSMTWERSGLRLAIAVDALIFFANVRPAYQWTHFSNTVVYAYGRSAIKRDKYLTFWDSKNGAVYTKQLPSVHFLISYPGADCCIVVYTDKVDEGGGGGSSSSSSGLKGSGNSSNAISNSSGNDTGKESKSSTNTTTNTVKNNSTSINKSTILQIRNAIGAITDTKKLTFSPKYMTMSPTYVFAANERTIYAYNFQQSASTIMSASGMSTSTLIDDTNGITSTNTTSGNTVGWKGKERMMDIENVTIAIPQPAETYKIIYDQIDNPIKCMCASEKYLLIARHDGTIIRFLLPYLNVENTYHVTSEPFRMELNCTSTKLAVIDIAGVLSVIDLTLPNDTLARDEAKRDTNATLELTYGKKLNIDRRDVWDIKWAQDDDNMLAVMEKTKMIMIVGESIDEPGLCSGYLAQVSDLEAKVVLCDELLNNPDQIPSADFIIAMETKLLRDTKDIVTVNGLTLGYSHVEKNSHPRLWKLLAELALEEMDLNIAEKCFVRCHDYFGVQFVKQLKSMPDKMKTRAEIEIYMKRFDEAESIYKEIDRKDLAVNMRKKVGDYTHVVQLLKGSSGSSIGSDEEIREALNDIGNTYCDSFQWKKAVQYFIDAGNTEKLIECYFRLQYYDDLKKLAFDMTENTPLLGTIATWFESVGMHEEAIECYIRYGNPKAAIDCCVALNRWGDALNLAEKYNFPQVEGLFIRLASQLISQGSPLKQLEAVELYRLANKPQDAAMLIGDIAEKIAREDNKPVLAKKLYVLAALEVERHRNITTDMAMANLNSTTKVVAQNTAATLDTLMMTSLDTKGGGGSRRAIGAFGSAWRGAAAYHYYMLAQNQLLRGNYDDAMRTAIRCCEYEDILGGKEIYTVICLASYKNNYYDVCSKAFIKLEMSPFLSDDERDQLETLSMKIFSVNAPNDPEPLGDPYIRCLDQNKGYKACLLSGRAILDDPTVVCKTCRHHMLQNEMELRSSSGANMTLCVLCHSTLK